MLLLTTLNPASEAMKFSGEMAGLGWRHDADAAFAIECDDIVVLGDDDF
ncbi:MAG: hypothetical protein ABW043_16885 [Devosia sp.]